MLIQDQQQEAFTRRLHTIQQHFQQCHPSDEKQLSLISHHHTASESFTNWAKIHSCQPKKIHRPKTEQDLIAIMSSSALTKEKIRVVGVGHSPSDISMTSEHMISLHENYNQILMVDREHHLVRVQSGIQLKKLNHELETKYSMSLSSLGSISEQTISGAISTGTHGTGIQFGCLGDTIVQLQVLCYVKKSLSNSSNNSGEQGEALHVQKLTLNKGSKDKRERDLLAAHLCGLGCLGIISTVTIQCEPLFYLTAVQKPMKFDQVVNQLPELIPSEDHWRFWYFPHTNDCITWGASRVNPPELIHHPKSTVSSLTNAVARRVNPLHMARDLNVYMRDRVVGYHLLELLLFVSKFVPKLVPFINRLYYHLLFSMKKVSTDVSYKVFNFDCLFYQFVNEWSIPIENTAIAMQQIKQMIETKRYNVHFPIEVRFVKGDDIWLSPCYGRDSCYIGIIMYRPYNYTIDYEHYFADFFKIMSALGGRPHWAKDFSLSEAQLRSMYPKWQQFKQLRCEVDPLNIFVNDYMQRLHIIDE